MSTDLTGLIPHGWQGGEAVTKWWRGKHIHLYRLRKNCAQCNSEMTLDVTKAAIVGTAKNAGLHLTRCQKCRDSTKAEGATSRPRTKDTPAETVQHEAPAAAGGQEIDMYVRSIQALQGQLDEERRKTTALFAEIQKLKAKLAPHELPTAMAAQAAAKPVAIVGGFPSAKSDAAMQKKMPWES